MVAEDRLSSAGMDNEISKAQVAQPGGDIIFRKTIHREIPAKITLRTKWAGGGGLGYAEGQEMQHTWTLERIQLSWAKAGHLSGLISSQPSFFGKLQIENSTSMFLAQFLLAL